MTIAKITPKNIPKIWEEEQSPIREYVHESLTLLEQDGYENTKAIIDARQFEDEMYSYRIKPTLSISSEDEYINFGWGIEDGTVEIKFYGDGIWSYEVTTPTTHLQYKGLGHPMSSKDFTYKKKRSPYIFVLDKPIEKYVTLKSEFVNTYEPLFKRAERSIYDYSVSVSWTTSYYDGPLTGYCRHNHRLYHFDLVEEADISGDRMYAIYELSLLERFKAYLSHFYWTTTMMIRPLYNFYMFRYRLRQRYENWRYKGEYYKIIHKKRDEWKAKHKIVGFFT